MLAYWNVVFSSLIRTLTYIDLQVENALSFQHVSNDLADFRIRTSDTPPLPSLPSFRPSFSSAGQPTLLTKNQPGVSDSPMRSLNCSTELMPFDKHLTPSKVQVSS